MHKQYVLIDGVVSFNGFKGAAPMSNEDIVKSLNALNDVCINNETHIKAQAIALKLGAGAVTSLVEATRGMAAALTKIAEWDNMDIKSRIDIGSNGQKKVIISIAEKALNEHLN